jgi:hypothetical protein
MATLNLANGDNFDLYVRVYDLNADKYAFNGVINPGDSRDVALQEDATNSYVHYHWSAIETRTDKSKAWHGAAYVDTSNLTQTIALAKGGTAAQLGATFYPAMLRPPP